MEHYLPNWEFEPCSGSPIDNGTGNIFRWCSDQKVSKVADRDNFAMEFVKGISTLKFNLKSVNEKLTANGYVRVNNVPWRSYSISFYSRGEGLGDAFLVDLGLRS